MYHMPMAINYWILWAGLKTLETNCLETLSCPVSAKSEARDLAEYWEHGLTGKGAEESRRYLTDGTWNHTHNQHADVVRAGPNPRSPCHLFCHIQHSTFIFRTTWRLCVRLTSRLLVFPTSFTTVSRSNTLETPSSSWIMRPKEVLERPW